VPVVRFAGRAGRDVLRDRFGRFLADRAGRHGGGLLRPDPERAQRAMKAMLGVRKIDLQALRDAADGVTAD
jgi:hypothetical protein